MQLERVSKSLISWQMASQTFVYRVADSLRDISPKRSPVAKITYQQAMIPQYQPFSLRSKGSSQARAFFLAEHDATELWIHGLRIAVEVRDVLIDHFQLASECAPCLASFSVTVASRRHVRPCLVYCGVYEEASGVGGPRCIPTNDLSVVVDKDHVGGFERGEVFSERIRPEGVRVLWVANAGAKSGVVAFPNCTRRLT
jgi:hypothetical protein